jgi:hypothetical protein
MKIFVFMKDIDNIIIGIIKNEKTYHPLSWIANPHKLALHILTLGKEWS